MLVTCFADYLMYMIIREQHAVISSEADGSTINC